MTETRPPQAGRPTGSPASAPESQAPETMEGWYVQHDLYTIDWKAWRGVESGKRETLIAELNDWLASAAAVEQGDSSAFIVSGQKAELMFIHYRKTPAQLNDVRRALMTCAFADLLIPAYGYLSIIEVSLYEATAIAHRNLAQAGIKHGSEDFAPALKEELEKQTKILEARCFRSIPDRAYCCFYPMSKRRGEQDNWYAMSLDERRALMRGHGRLGHKYHQSVTQIISGSTGLDDWEWGVDLHSDDPLIFKKLVYEMRFDPVSARFAEFGAFYIGERVNQETLRTFLLK